MSARELAWAAGLFEGEGCISVKRQQGKYAYPILKLTMTDEDTVRRFHAAVGVGSVYGPRFPQGGRKAVWDWSSQRFEHVQHCIAQLWFGLGARRRARATEVLGGKK